MASTGFHGVFDLDEAVIDRAVTQTSPGAYVLGDVDPDDGSFVVRYVGRSDTDLNSRLKAWAQANKYSKFKAGYFSSPKAAFEKECTLYHDFAPPDNQVHPRRPDNTNWSCPTSRCTAF